MTNIPQSLVISKLLSEINTLHISQYIFALRSHFSYIISLIKENTSQKIIILNKKESSSTFSAHSINLLAAEKFVHSTQSFKENLSMQASGSQHFKV